MIEMNNLTLDELKEVIDNCPYEVMFNKVIVTLNKEEGIALNSSDAGLSEEQYIIAGNVQYDSVRINPGDKVLLDLESMRVPVRNESVNAYETEYQIKINPIFIGDRMYAIINDRTIKAKIK